MKGLMFLSMMLWGLTWSASKIMVEQLDPFVIICIKCGIVTLSFLPILFYLKIPFTLHKNAIIPTILVGVFNTIYNYLLLIGLHYGEAGNAGVIAEALSPIFATIIWVFIKKSSLLRKEKIGLTLGVISALFLVDIFHPEGLFSPFNVIYIFAALMWALITISSRYATDALNPLIINFYSSLLPFVLFLPSLFFGNIAPIVQTNWQFWLSMFSVTILSTTIATSIFYKGIKVLGVTQGGIFVLLVPVAALIFAWLLLDETPKIHTLIGGAIAIGAIYLINFYRSKK